MAPSRGKGKANSRAPASTARRSTRSRVSGNDLSDVYHSMLQEADALQTESDDQMRPLKKRRVATPASAKSEASQPPQTISQAQTLSATPSRSRPAYNLQIVEDSSESDDSDIEFEDVDLGRLDRAATEETEDDIEDLSISVEAASSTKPSGQPRRRPATYAEKAHRLLVHKLHILCLLGHSMYVNGWCSNAAVHKHLRHLLNAKAVSFLKPKAEFSQFQKQRSFLGGLEQAIAAFNIQYRIVARGLQRPQWDVEGDAGSVKEYAAPMDRTDFIESAKNLAGSQDVGNQLFCAMLRSVGVQARLVCSLQPLPFGSVPKASTPKKPVKQKIMAMASDKAPSSTYSEHDPSLTSSNISSIRRRLGHASFVEQTPQAPIKKAKPVPKLAFPIYWVEAFNDAYQKWVSVDAVVTQTVGQPSKLEPPASYKPNQLTYAIAFEENGAARDVTKRYAKAFNAKTRRQRVESSNEGARWLKKAMRIFRRANGLLDRDQVEDAELAQKEAREGMPGNVLDFKDHPFYALERHLKRHEVIHPKREVGKVNAGTAAKPRMEAVYRRQDLFSCKSSDKWYRCGREIKPGEQPLKHITKRVGRQRSVGDHEEAEDVASTGLYAPHQTQLYVPPPVERGRVPRNAYGNLDIYVPSMVPSGGVHIRHKLAKDASRLLRVDFAEAVTGFSFKGRQGTAIIEGAVVATQFADAVRAVIEGFEDQVVEEESKVRSLEALRLWKRFAVGLRIVERVSGYGDGNDEMSLDERAEAADEVTEPGGFFPDSEEHAMPTAGRFSVAELKRKANPKRKISDSDSEGQSPLIEVEDDGQFIARPIADTDMAGGFLLEKDKEQDAVAKCTGRDYRGGLLPESNDESRGFPTKDGKDGRNPGGDEGGSLLDDNKAVPNLEEGQPPLQLAGPWNAVGSRGADNGVAPVSSAQRNSTEIDVESIARLQTSIVSKPSTTLEHNLSAKNAEKRSKDEDSDKGSLLSHDPDDEDAEPDWLESE